MKNNYNVVLKFNYFIIVFFINFSKFIKIFKKKIFLNNGAIIDIAKIKWIFQ